MGGHSITVGIYGQFTTLTPLFPAWLCLAERQEAETRHGHRRGPLGTVETERWKWRPPFREGVLIAYASLRRLRVQRPPGLGAHPLEAAHTCWHRSGGPGRGRQAFAPCSAIRP